MKVLMLGPDLRAHGGVATLERSLVESRALSGVDLRFIPTVGEGSAPRRAAQMLGGQARVAAAAAWPDLVHMHISDGLSFWRKSWYQAQFRCPVVLHANFAHLEELQARHPAAVRRTFSRASKVLVVSRAMESLVRRWTGGAARVAVLPNPVPTLAFKVPERGEAVPPTVLFMGRVGARKGIFDLLAAWPRVEAEVPGARLKVAGDGDLQRLRALAPPSVEVLGWVEGEARLTLFENATVYCLPSYAEGLPLSVLEAMAAGLPVVASAVDGVPEAVDERNGILVEPGDSAGLAAALIALLRDGERRRRLGASGRARAEAEFDVEVVAARLLEHWREVLGNA